MGQVGPKRHTDKTGDISEAAIIARLLQVGYNVFTPYGKNHRCDLVIEDADGQFWRVQCKTGWLDENQTIITFATASSYNHTAVANVIIVWFSSSQPVLHWTRQN